MERAGPGKKPAQVGTTTAAQPQLPDKTGKPAELAALLAHDPHTWCLIKTANIKNNASGIKKHMSVPAIDQSGFTGGGQWERTQGALYGANIFANLCTVLIWLGGRSMPASCFGIAGSLAQLTKKNRLAVRRHGHSSW